jgi:beta-1,2-mannosidase
MNQKISLRPRPAVIIACAAALLAAVAWGADQDWVWGPFSKQDEFNPVLSPADSAFACPLAGAKVRWEDSYVYNPAAVVRDGKVYLIYRAQGSAGGKFSRTSRLGLAESDDGLHFTRRPGPVLYPGEDAMKRYEWPGGCEDPRVVEDEAGTYYLTYTAFDGKIARLAVASSADLVHWQKHGLAFAKAYDGKYANIWSKSGAIVTALRDGRPKAVRINGQYWMYWGDSEIFVAVSDNLIDWTPLVREDRAPRSAARLLRPGTRRLQRLLAVRPGNFDSALVESGPPPLLTERGIVFIYNAKNFDHPLLPKETYAAGQALLRADNPAELLDRTDSWFLRPELPYETTGLVANVVFAEGLVRFRQQYFLYYGAADSRIAAATVPAE